MNLLYNHAYTRIFFLETILFIFLMSMYFLSWFVCVGGYKQRDVMGVGLTPKVVLDNLVSVANNTMVDGSSYYGADLTESQPTPIGVYIL